MTTQQIPAYDMTPEECQAQVEQLMAILHQYEGYRNTINSLVNNLPSLDACTEQVSEHLIDMGKTHSPRVIRHLIVAWRTQQLEAKLERMKR